VNATTSPSDRFEKSALVWDPVGFPRGELHYLTADDRRCLPVELVCLAGAHRAAAAHLALCGLAAKYPKIFRDQNGSAGGRRTTVRWIFTRPTLRTEAGALTHDPIGAYAKIKHGRAPLAEEQSLALVKKTRRAERR